MLATRIGPRLNKESLDMGVLALLLGEVYLPMLACFGHVEKACRRWAATWLVATLCAGQWLRLTPTHGEQACPPLQEWAATTVGRVLVVSPWLLLELRL